jgi:hypothetical protein
MSYWLSDFAECLLRSQKYEEADQALREAEQVVAETDERSHFGELLRQRGCLLVLCGKVADGSAKLWQAVEWTRSRDTRLFELRALRDLVRLGIPQDELRRAEAALQEVIAWFPPKLQIPDLNESRDALKSALARSG